MKKLNITFCSFPDYSGNAKALYEYMVKKYENNMNYTWIVYSESTIDLLKTQGINSILIGTDEFNEYIPKTNVFFTTHANLAEDKIKAKKSIYVELWHGIGPKPIGFLANNLSETDEKWYEFLSETIDYLIVPSDFWRNMFAAFFNINAKRVKPLGLPLIDEILNSNGRENLEKILNINLNKYNKIILYAPTFKSGCGRKLEATYNKKNIFDLKKYSEKDLIKFLKQNNYLLVIKRHPSDECVYETIENDYIKNIDNDELDNSGLNINSILNIVDMLITDYSSLGVEFSFLNKPVIYVSTSLDEYKNNRGILMNDYDFWTNGVYCDTYEKLIELINLNMDKKVISNNRKLIYGDLKDGGCDRICDFLFEENQIRPNIERYKSKILRLKKENKNLKNIVNEQVETIKKLTESDIELKQIKNSKSWILLEKIRKIKNK